MALLYMTLGCAKWPLPIGVNLFEPFVFRSEIEECPDQDTSKMQAKLSLVPIDQLSLFIGKKVCTWICYDATKIKKKAQQMA